MDLLIRSSLQPLLDDLDSRRAAPSGTFGVDYIDDSTVDHSAQLGLFGHEAQREVARPARHTTAIAGAGVSGMGGVGMGLGGDLRCSQVGQFAVNRRAQLAQLIHAKRRNLIALLDPVADRRLGDA